MTPRSLALAVLAAAAVLWWFTAGDPEAAVRSAHLDLESFIAKDAPESGAAAALLSLSLRDLFADPLTISGDAAGLVGVYSPEDFAGTIVRLRAAATSIDAMFGELTIEFPEADIAVTEFSAEIIAESGLANAGFRQEVRRVTSRMRDFDGTWLFTEIALVE